MFVIVFGEGIYTVGEVNKDDWVTRAEQLLCCHYHYRRLCYTLLHSAIIGRAGRFGMYMLCG